MAEALQTFSHDSYTVGWICALPETELAVSGAMLDKRHAVLPLTDSGDTTTYLLGKIGPHNVVMACCPDQETGKVSAALVAKDMLRTFKAVRFCLMVGIGGGVPRFELDETEQDLDDALEYWDSQEQRDIRLGDVVIGSQTKTTPAVVQFDFGKALHGGKWEVSGALNDPPDTVRGAISQLKGEHIRKGTHTLSKHLLAMTKENPGLARNFKYQGVEKDQVIKPHIVHPKNAETCKACFGSGNANVVQQKRRKDPLIPVLHYGTIGSADQVMKDPAKRDALHKEHKIICFEMEAAGKNPKLRVTLCCF
jgi:nucleoside phosphorylase